MRRLRRDQRGFLLVELLTTMAVFSIFIGAVSLIFSGAIRSSTQSSDQAIVQTEARAAMDALAAELRQAYSDSTFPSGNWLKTMTGTTLTFYTPDRSSPFHLREVSYQLSGGKLQRAFVTSTNTGAGPWVVGGDRPAVGDSRQLSTMFGSVSNSTALHVLRQQRQPDGDCRQRRPRRGDADRLADRRAGQEHHLHRLRGTEELR